MIRSVIGGKLLGLTLLLCMPLVACVGDEPDLDESTEDATEELVASEVGADLDIGDRSIPDAEFDASSGEIEESAPVSIPGQDRIEPEPIPWVPNSKPTDPDPKAGPSPLPA